MIQNGSTLKNCYTVKEVAEILHVHPNTVYGLVKRNILKPIRVTRWFRFPKAQVDAILNGDSTGGEA